MTLTVKERELVNVGASVATGCKPCTDYHFEKVRGAGATDAEIKRAITDAVAVRDSAREIMESHGLQHLGIVRAGEQEPHETSTTRIRELVAVGAAFAVNCTTNLERHDRPSRRFLVEPGAVVAWAQEGRLKIVSYIEHWTDEGRHEAQLLETRT